MKNDSEETLRRLFSETRNEPADEAFVERVAARMARRRLFRNAAVTCGSLALIALVALLHPIASGPVEFISQIPVRFSDSIAAFLASPAGWVISVLIGVGTAAEITLGTSD